MIINTWDPIPSPYTKQTIYGVKPEMRGMRQVSDRVIRG